MVQASMPALHAPLIAKLQSWGYDSLYAHAPLPLAAVVEKLDTAAMAIMEKLTHDLTCMNETCHNLRTQLTSMSDNLHKERLRAESLRVLNERLVKDSAEMQQKCGSPKSKEESFSTAIKQNAPLSSNEEEVADPDGTLQQWRTVSMQRIKELESANEALRATLSKLSPGPSTECKASKSDSVAQIVVSQKLAPSVPSLCGNQPELVCSRGQMEKELQDKVCILTNKLEMSQADVAAKDRHIQQLYGSSQARRTGDAARDGIFSVSDVESLRMELVSLKKAFDDLLMDNELNDHSLGRQSAVEIIRQEVDATYKLLQKGQGGNERTLQEGTQMIEHKLQKLETVISELEARKDCPQHQSCESTKRLALSTEKSRCANLEKGKDAGTFNAEEWTRELDIPKILTELKLMRGKIILYQSGSKVETLQTKFESIRSVMLEHESTISKLQSEVSQKNEQLSFVSDEKVAAEEALAASQKECSQLESLIKELDGSMTQLTSALTARTMERDYAVAAEKREAQSRTAAIDELTRNRSNLISELDAAQADVAKVQSELDRSKIQREEDRFHLAEARKQAEQAEKDVDQLKTLITQLDSTREELVAKLKSSIADQQLAENRQAALELELRRFVEQAETHSGEVAHLHKVLEALGKERDHLLSEMEIHSEKVAHISEENSRLQAEARFMKRTLQSTEQKLNTEHSLRQQAESQVATLKDQLAVEETHRKAAEGRCASKVGELQTMTEDVTNLTCEYQRVKNELARASTDRDQLMTELKNATSKLEFSDQVISAKEKEEEGMLKTYERLYEDNQQLKLAAIEMENQLQQQSFQLQTVEDLLHRSEDQVSTLQEEIHQHVAGFQGLQRQADIMSRSLAQQSALLDDYQKEKAVLVNQLSTAKQFAMELDQSRANSMREMKALETRNQCITGHLQEAQQEIDALSTRYRLEHERVRELEQLLACLRAQEHQLELEHKDSNAKSAMLREQLFSLEEQVRTLQITRDAQNQEILRLQAKNEFEESRRCSAGIPASPLSSRSVESQYLHTSGESGSKVRDLESRIMSLTADLSKTSSLYNDCCERLQRAETQSLELKKEYEHVLTLMTKVEEDRAQLQRRNLDLAVGVERTEVIRSRDTPPSREDKKIKNPELKLLQTECDRLKKDLASSEASRKAVETDFQLLISSVEEIKDDLVSKSSVPSNLDAYICQTNFDSD